jgi:hypothetical protein
MAVNDDVGITVLIPGAPVVNHGLVVAEGPGVVAIAIDMQSKYCILEATGSTHNTNGEEIPSVTIGAQEGSQYLEPKAPKGDSTEIAFPDYVGYKVFCADMGKYSLSVCLIKP